MRREVTASVAKAQLSELLDQVEKGDTVVITRHGREIGELMPTEAALRRRREQAIANLKELRSRLTPVSIEEILSARDEGRR